MQSSLDWLEELHGGSLADEAADLASGNPNPPLAFVNLTRWLSATGNPHAYLEQVLAEPNLAKHFLTLLGTCQPIADILIQNPELGPLILDPTTLGAQPAREGIVREGRRLVAASTSYSHALDRLRFLKQRWTLPIVVNDLYGNWCEEDVWLAISALAAALIQLATEVTWKEFAENRDLPAACPILIVGFGKLGGDELNFSSDIDLVYVIQDGGGEQFESEATRFCEMLGRALGDRMGRGALYRVDLRLRPYGSAGPLVASMRAVENYYRLYAEQWEVQALLRSKPLFGPADLAERWEAMRIERCFRPAVSEPELESMLAMKSRIEERSHGNDLKRGAGGIRDVEFLVQVLQLIHGYREPAVRIAGTIPALRELEKHGILDHAVAKALCDSYMFLRQLEHRLQLVGDQQTHDMPTNPAGQGVLAKLMGAPDWSTLKNRLDSHRRAIQTLYQTTLRPIELVEDERAAVGKQVGQSAPSILQWFDTLPGGASFYPSLLENQDSLSRVTHIAAHAPRLVNDFKASVGLTELLVSGEIEEDFEPSASLDHLPLDTQIHQIAQVFNHAKVRLIAQWLLVGEIDLPARLADLADALIRHCASRVGAEFDVIGLGSLGQREMGIDSDADLLLLVEASEAQSRAEQAAQQFLSQFGQLRRAGCTLQVDLRLRPDGGKGMLVRSLEALGAYELSDMEMWERFALGSARLIIGSPESLAAVRRVALAQPLTPERLTELLDMKKRVETERLQPKYQHRDVKLGHGGLNDLEWMIHLHEMRYPTATRAADRGSTPDRIKRLGRAGLLNSVEVEQLQDGFAYLMEVRIRLALLGHEMDIIPENPDRLTRLANSMEIPAGNDFLAVHQRVTDTIRGIYLTSLERLKA